MREPERGRRSRGQFLRSLGDVTKVGSGGHRRGRTDEGLILARSLVAKVRQTARVGRVTSGAGGWEQR